jgi:hypothetical protein
MHSSASACPKSYSDVNSDKYTHHEKRAGGLIKVKTEPRKAW